MILLLIQIAKRKKKMNWFPNRKSGSRKVGFFLPIFSWRCFSKEKNSDAAIESLFTTLKKFLPFFYFLQKSQFSFRRTQKSRKRVVACNRFSWKDVGWIEFRFAMSKIFLQTCVDTFANTFVQSFKSAQAEMGEHGIFWITFIFSQMWHLRTLDYCTSHFVQKQLCWVRILLPQLFFCKI